MRSPRTLGISFVINLPVQEDIERRRGGSIRATVGTIGVLTVAVKRVLITRCHDTVLPTRLRSPAAPLRIRLACPGSATLSF